MTLAIFWWDPSNNCNYVKHLHSDNLNSITLVGPVISCLADIYRLSSTTDHSRVSVLCEEHPWRITGYSLICSFVPIMIESLFLEFTLLTKVCITVFCNTVYICLYMLDHDSMPLLTIHGLALRPSDAFEILTY